MTTKQDFLFELGCEELPPKALPKLAETLHANIIESLKTLELDFENAEWFATPRRIAVRVTELDTAQKDKQVEKLGPAVTAAFDEAGNPKPAAQGFARSNGVTVEALSRKETDKGERLAFIADVKGEETANLLPEVLQKATSNLPVPKAMRWGDSKCQFTRPVHWVLAILGDKVVDVELFEVQSSNITYGHRFHSPQAISISAAGNYEHLLIDAKVVSSFEARKAQIRIQVDKLATDNNATAIIDEDLLEEVTALVEWPVALLGKFDNEFLEVPQEALVSSMAEHQKYFHLVDSNNQLLANFITVSNIESSNPASVIDGNEKVIRPRLADAKFFYDTDKKTKLIERQEKLKTVVFQNKLGTLFDKTMRIQALAKSIASSLGFDADMASRAAEICKCDLMTDMVGEFSDLQGIMGRYYAANDGEPTEISAAMDEIYMPRFAGDELPTTNTGLVLALAERIDTLVGIFGIGQLPTGAKDPFALRRASLGVLRLITEKSLDLDLTVLIDESLKTYNGIELDASAKTSLLEFFAARTLSSYQEKEISSQVIHSVQALNITKPLDFNHRVLAVESFNQKSESADLAEANKRVKNILAKSNVDTNAIRINEDLFEAEEKALYSTINEVSDKVESLVRNSDYETALNHLANLKDVVNNFFDNVMVNAEDPTIRNNRLALISRLRNLFLGIADISLLQK